MRFRTQYDVHDRVPSQLGSRVKSVYSPVFDKNGVIDLEETGKENLYDYIQSHKDSVDIHKILDRFAQGDVQALSRVQGLSGDFTDMPKTYAEALNAVISAEQTFNSLPVDTRAKFGHSFSQFLAQTGTPAWLSAMGISVDSPAAASGDTDRLQGVSNSVPVKEEISNE